MLYVYIYVVYFVMYDSVLILLLSYGHHGWFNKVFLFYSLWFYQNILWNRYHRNVRIILTDNIFFWWRFFFPTNIRYSYWYQLCSSSNSSFIRIGLASHMTSHG